MLGDRFRVYSCYDPEPRLAENYAEYEYLLSWSDDNVLLDTQTNRIVYADGGEPEDQTLTRDQAVLVDLLNEVAATRQEG